MEYQLALSPDLNLTPDEFVSAWNASPERRAAAQASLQTSKSAQYDLVSAVVPVLGGLALGLATNALYDLIKGLLLERGVRQQVEIVQLDGLAGERLLVIRIEQP